MKNDIEAFRRLSTADQLRALRGEKAERTFHADRANGIDEKKRTVWLSIASDAPYSRYWGIEILDMNRASIRDTRLRMGAPLLVGHDTADQVGVVESYEITGDNKLRVLARFGKSAGAEEIWRDVLDGIRRNASVGYVIHDLVLEKQGDGVNTYRVTDWEPLEGSIVPVPADPSVGVGRALDVQRPAINEQEKSRMNDSNRPATPGSADAEHQRVTSLMEAGRNYASWGGEQVARELVMDRSATMDTFKARMLESMRTKPFNTAQPADVPPYWGEGARAGLNIPRLTAFKSEREAYESGLWIKADVLGDQRAQQQRRDMGIATNTGGGALAPIEFSSAVVYLQEQYGVFRQAAQVFPMSSDQLVIPRRRSSPTVYFVAENDAATSSDQSWDQVQLSTKKIAILTRASNELIETNPATLADILARDIAVNFAQKEDQCGFSGDGTSTYGGMTGLLKILIDGSHNAGKVAAASTHKTFGTLDNADLANLMSALPWYARPGAKWYCSSVAWDRTFSRLVAAAGGNSIKDLSQAPRQAFLGHEVIVSQVMPAGPTTDYNGQVMILFGDLSMASAMGMSRELTLRVDQSRYLEYDQTAFMATERFDIVNHGCGDNTNAGPIVGLIGTT